MNPATTSEGKSPKHQEVTATDVALVKKRHRSRQIVTKGGNLELEFSDAGLTPRLTALTQILGNCPAGATLAVHEFEITAKSANREQVEARIAELGYTPLCACEFAAWAIAHGKRVDKDTTWLTVTTADDGKTVTVALSQSQVYTFAPPANFGKGVVILAIDKKTAEYRNDQQQ
jgi:hypothetical protein